MSYTFNRRYHLSVFTKSDIFVTEFSEHRLSAEVKYSSQTTSASSDTFTLVIYNLSDWERLQFLEDDAVVVLRAGYGSEQGADKPVSEYPIILKGDIVSTKFTRSGTETALMITLSSAATELKSAITQVKLNKGESLETLIDTIANTIGVDYSVNLGQKESVILSKSLSFSGTPMEILHSLANTYGLNVYFLENVLNIVNEKECRLATPTGVVLRIPTDRIKGSLDVSKDISKNDTETPNTEITFTTMLNPEIKLGTVIQVDIRDNINEFTVVALKHSLDTHGNVWDTSVTAITQ